MEREQLKPEPVAPKPPGPDKPVKAAAPQQQQLTVDNINGQLTELSEHNQHLTARMVKMRGQMADMERTIANQQEVIQKQAAELAAGKTVLGNKKRNGR